MIGVEGNREQRGFRMAQQLDRHISVESTNRKAPSKPTPSSQELAKRYFDLQCLRQRVKIAESGQAIGRERIKTPSLASYT
jgi:hypothetical protein